MERAPEDAALGALGLAGICRETLRVILSRPPGSPFLCGVIIALSLSLLAHVGVSPGLFPGAVASSDTGAAGLIRRAANWALFFLAEAAFLCTIVFHSLVSTVLCVLSVAPRYSGFAADANRDTRDLRDVPGFLAEYLVSIFRGDSRLAARLVRTGPAVFVRVADTSCVAFFLLLGYTALLGGVAVLMHQHLPRAALLVVGGAAYLAGAAHIGAMWRVACVLSVMEDGARGVRAMHASDELFTGARGVRAMRASHELLTGAGRFWAEAALFTTLDVCAVAVQLAFGALVVDDRMGLSVLLRVAVGVLMAAALWATVVAVLVAQVVVYFVCKSYRRSGGRSSGGAAKSLTDVGRKGRASRDWVWCDGDVELPVQTESAPPCTPQLPTLLSLVSN